MELANIFNGLNPCDCFLWGLLKDVYWNIPHSVEELKDEITAFALNIFKRTLVGVMENFRRR
jgi:hypothetical protein